VRERVKRVRRVRVKVRVRSGGVPGENKMVEDKHTEAAVFSNGIKVDLVKNTLECPETPLLTRIGDLRIEKMNVTFPFYCSFSCLHIYYIFHYYYVCSLSSFLPLYSNLHGTAYIYCLMVVYLNGTFCFFLIACVLGFLFLYIIN